MLPYFIMVGIPAYLSVLIYFFQKNSRYRFDYRADYNHQKTYQLVIDSFFLIWLLLLIFRGEKVGIDLSTYKYHFNNYSSMTWETILTNGVLSDHEPAYVLLCKLISIVSGDFRGVIIVSALISVIPIWKLYRNDGKNGFLTIVLFLNIAPFVMYFSGLRQAMAMAFIVPCYYCCKSNKALKFILWVMIAYLFHKSSVILLLMYPVYHIKWRKKINLLYLLPIIAIIYLFKLPIFRFLLMFMNEKYIERYTEGIKSTGAYAVLLLLIVLLIYSFVIVDQLKLDNDTVGLRNILVISVVLQVFSGVHSIAMRMNYYYLLFIPLIIDHVIRIGDDKEKKILQISKVCMVVFFTVYYFYFAYTDADILNVYPYKPFWVDM